MDELDKAQHKIHSQKFFWDGGELERSSSGGFTADSLQHEIPHTAVLWTSIVLVMG